MQAQAHIHSLDGGLADVEILSHADNNNVIARYNGKRCSAIFNPFVGRYYVDDKYGILPDEPARKSYHKSKSPSQQKQEPER